MLAHCASLKSLAYPVCLCDTWRHSCRLHSICLRFSVYPTGVFPSLFIKWLLTQSCVDLLPGLIPTPFVIMIVHAVIVRLFARQIAPLAARPQDVQDGIDHGSQFQPHRSPRSPVLIDVQPGDDGPLFVCQITCIPDSFLRHSWLTPAGFNWLLIPPILPFRSLSLIPKQALDGATFEIDCDSVSEITSKLL